MTDQYWPGPEDRPEELSDQPWPDVDDTPPIGFLINTSLAAMAAKIKAAFAVPMVVLPAGSTPDDLLQELEERAGATPVQVWRDETGRMIDKPPARSTPKKGESGPPRDPFKKRGRA